MIDHAAERRRLLRFARASEAPAGFGWLDERGALDPAEPVHTWITTRMTYVFALAELAGESDAVDGRALALAEHGVLPWPVRCGTTSTAAGSLPCRSTERRSTPGSRPTRTPSWCSPRRRRR